MEKLLITIVFTGDSITLGEHIDPNKCWVSLTSKHLEKHYKKDSVSFYVVNSGVNGATTRIGLELFPKNVQRFNPDIVVIQYGFNDCNRWVTDRGLRRVSEGAFRENLREMLERSKHFGASHVIFVNNHPTLRYTKQYEKDNSSYSAVISCIRGKILFDIRWRIESAIPQLSKFLVPYPDNLHLNEEGHKFYATHFWQIIKKVVDEVIEGKKK